MYKIWVLITMECEWYEGQALTYKHYTYYK